MIDKTFGVVDKNIIEVGGHLPRLADIQKNGKVVVYVSLLSIYEENSTDLILKRMKFNTRIYLDNTDLLVGLMPCSAANCIVDYARKSGFIV